MTKNNENQGPSNQLKALIGCFLENVRPALEPQGVPEGFHVIFNFSQSIKSENSIGLIDKLGSLSDKFERTSERSGMFKSARPDCEVYLKSVGDSIELKMVSIVSEEEDESEIKVLGENCKSAFLDAIEFVNSANR